MSSDFGFLDSAFRNVDMRMHPISNQTNMPFPHAQNHVHQPPPMHPHKIQKSTLLEELMSDSPFSNKNISLTNTLQTINKPKKKSKIKSPIKSTKSNSPTRKLPIGELAVNINTTAPRSLRSYHTLSSNADLLPLHHTTNITNQANKFNFLQPNKFHMSTTPPKPNNRPSVFSIHPTTPSYNPPPPWTAAHGPAAHHVMNMHHNSVIKAAASMEIVNFRNSRKPSSLSPPSEEATCSRHQPVQSSPPSVVVRSEDGFDDDQLDYCYHRPESQSVPNEVRDSVIPKNKKYVSAYDFPVSDPQTPVYENESTRMISPRLITRAVQDFNQDGADESRTVLYNTKNGGTSPSSESRIHHHHFHHHHSASPPGSSSPVVYRDSEGYSRIRKILAREQMEAVRRASAAAVRAVDRAVTGNKYAPHNIKNSTTQNSTTQNSNNNVKNNNNNNGNNIDNKGDGVFAMSSGGIAWQLSPPLFKRTTSASSQQQQFTIQNTPVKNITTVQRQAIEALTPPPYEEPKLQPQNINSPVPPVKVLSPPSTSIPSPPKPPQRYITLDPTGRLGSRATRSNSVPSWPTSISPAGKVTRLLSSQLRNKDTIIADIQMFQRMLSPPPPPPPSQPPLSQPMIKPSPPKIENPSVRNKRVQTRTKSSSSSYLTPERIVDPVSIHFDDIPGSLGSARQPNTKLASCNVENEQNSLIKSLDTKVQQLFDLISNMQNQQQQAKRGCLGVDDDTLPPVVKRYLPVDGSSVPKMRLKSTFMSNQAAVSPSSSLVEAVSSCGYVSENTTTSSSSVYNDPKLFDGFKLCGDDGSCYESVYLDDAGFGDPSTAGSNPTRTRIVPLISNTGSLILVPPEPQILPDDDEDDNNPTYSNHATHVESSSSSHNTIFFTSPLLPSALRAAANNTSSQSHPSKGTNFSLLLDKTAVINSRFDQVEANATAVLAKVKQKLNLPSPSGLHSEVMNQHDFALQALKSATENLKIHLKYTNREP